MSKMSQLATEIEELRHCGEPRKMMGIDSEGMLISAVYEYDGREGLNLLMLDDSIPAGAKLY